MIRLNKQNAMHGNHYVGELIYPTILAMVDLQSVPTRAQLWMKWRRKQTQAMVALQI